MADKSLDDVLSTAEIIAVETLMNQCTSPDPKLANKAANDIAAIRAKNMTPPTPPQQFVFNVGIAREMKLAKPVDGGPANVEVLQIDE